MTRVCAVVLNYRNWPQMQAVLTSLAEQTLRIENVVVVDNASGTSQVDAMASALSGSVELLPLDVNDGYAVGMNAGIRRAVDLGADAVLLLTHDVVLEPRCVELLVDELVRHPATGLAAPVLGWGGQAATTWSAGGTLGTLTGTPNHPEKGRDLDTVLHAPTRTVAWADGAALLVRRDVIDELGLLPEQYFLYFEEVDFQARIRRSGRDVRVVSGALAWQTPGRTPLYLATRNQLLWLRSGQRRAIPFFLAVVLYRCVREVAKRVLRRSPNLDRVRAMLSGLVDGRSGRLRRELLTLA